MLQRYLTVGLFLLSDLFLKGLTSIVRGPSMLNASLGETLCIKCQYEKDYYNYIKYWCGGTHWNNCDYLVETDGTEKEKRDGRYVIKDNRTEREFTVRMENITKEDAGIYWCAIRKSLGDPKWEVNIAVVAVTKELPPTSITTVGYFSTTSTSPTEISERSPNSSDPDLLILLPVVLGLLVLILGGTTLLMWKLKKKKATKNSKSPLPSTVSPPPDQAADGTEVAYTTVTPTQFSASKSQSKKLGRSVERCSTPCLSFCRGSKKLLKSESLHHNWLAYLDFLWCF